MHSIDDAVMMRAFRRQPIDRTPVWIMRQAGRYLPEYRKIRQQAGDFMSLCRNPELACEVTLQPLRRFPLDAAILFSDILTVPEAMGLGLYFSEGEGPRFRHPVQDEAAIQAIPEIEVESSLAYVFDAVRLIRREMPSHLPLLGFAGSPWTLACYMIEGRGSKTFETPKTMLHKAPQLLHSLLEKVTLATQHYLAAQIDAGANAVMLFDTWGGLLPTSDYKAFSLHYLEKIVHSIKKHSPNTPVILFTKGGASWLEDMSATGCDVLGLDWNCPLSEARARVGKQVALQGNINPAVLLEEPESIRKAVRAALESFGLGSGHIFNLGHGITPAVNPDHLMVLLETVHTDSPQFHKCLV
jgi:uroporphyrinogen decarboxylase